MNVLRPITAAVLFVCMLVPLLTPVYLQLKQLHIQHEMLEKLEKAELLSIRVKADNIQWVKPGKECVIGNEMFDVKRIKHEGDDLVLTGLYDAKEKALKKLAAAHSQEQSKQSGYTIKLLSLVLFPAEYVSLQPIVLTQHKAYPSFNNRWHLNPYIGFITPPPRFDA